MSVVRSCVSLAWANVTGRRTAAVTLIAVIAAQSIVVLTLLILLRDEKGNVRAYYQREPWRHQLLVSGDIQASGSLTSEQLSELRATPGVLAVTPEWLVSTTVTGEGRPLQVRNWTSELDARLVAGRVPAGSSCEAAVTSDIDTASLGSQLRVQVVGDGTEAGPREPLLLTVTGILDRGFPLFGGAGTALVSCDLTKAARGPASAPLPVADAIVSTKPGTALPGFQYVSLQQVADDQIRGSHSSGGMIVLLGVVLAGLGFVTAFVVARGGTRTRGHEFSVRRSLGHSRRSVLLTTWLEAAFVAVSGVVLAVPLAVLLAKRLLRMSSWLDSESPWRFALPSATSVGMMLAGCLASVLLATGLTLAAFLRADPAVALRRRRE